MDKQKIDAGFDQIHADVTTALHLLETIEDATQGHREESLVHAAQIVLRRIGLVQQRLSNLVSPGRQDDADPATWLLVDDLFDGRAPDVTTVSAEDLAEAKAAIGAVHAYTRSQLTGLSAQ